MSSTVVTPPSRESLNLRDEHKSGYESILSDEALDFVAGLIEAFSPRVSEILAARSRRQQQFDEGQLPDFPPETADIRNSSWTVAPVPAELQDRRVEITGPVDARMIVNGLNSGANVFMADFEDASSPTWTTMMQGQVNLKNANRRTIDFTADNGKSYRLNDSTAVLMVRPRGWHLHEGHVTHNNRPVPAALWDFGLYFFHNARTLLEKGSAPYFYLPKLQSYQEAKLWNDVFNHAQDALGIPRGTIRATVLIETLPAAFEMDEILYELRDHSAGLNCGRWDYIFSYIKCFRNNPDRVLPDRAQVTMQTGFMEAYSKLLIKTCHRRGVHAIGGMAAQLPVREDPYINDAYMNKVRDDKEREVCNGHDGSWVSHPAFVPVCREVFDRHMPAPNQIDRRLDDVEIGQDELLQQPRGSISMQGVMNNVGAAVGYLQAWLNGQGAVPLNNLMEDAATAEISRTQLWQWVHSPKGVLTDGRKVTPDLFREVLAWELQRLRLLAGNRSLETAGYLKAADLLERVVLDDALPEFMTLEAYPELG